MTRLARVDHGNECQGRQVIFDADGHADADATRIVINSGILPGTQDLVFRMLTVVATSNTDSMLMS